jgi:hypothetical protein
VIRAAHEALELPPALARPDRRSPGPAQLIDCAAIVPARIDLVDPGPEGAVLAGALRAAGFEIAIRTLHDVPRTRADALVLAGDAEGALEALRKLRDDGVAPDTPVLLVGTPEGTSHLGEGPGFGAQAVFLRPTPLGRLADAIRRIVEARPSATSPGRPISDRIASVIHGDSREPTMQLPGTGIGARDVDGLPPVLAVAVERGTPTGAPGSSSSGASSSSSSSSSPSSSSSSSPSASSIPPSSSSFQLPGERTPASDSPLRGGIRGPAASLSDRLRELLIAADRRAFPLRPPIDLSLPAGEDSADELVPNELLERDEIAFDPPPEDDPIDAFTFVGGPALPSAASISEAGERGSSEGGDDEEPAPRTSPGTPTSMSRRPSAMPSIPPPPLTSSASERERELENDDAPSPLPPRGDPEPRPSPSSTGVHYLPEPRLPEPRLPEPRLPEPRLPEPRLPEPRLPEPRERTDAREGLETGERSEARASERPERSEPRGGGAAGEGDSRGADEGSLEPRAPTETRARARTPAPQTSGGLSTATGSDWPEGDTVLGRASPEGGRRGTLADGGALRLLLRLADLGLDARLTITSSIRDTIAMTIVGGELAALEGPVALRATEILRRRGTAIVPAHDEVSARRALEDAIDRGALSTFARDRALREGREALLGELIVASRANFTLARLAIEERARPIRPLLSAPLGVAVLEAARIAIDHDRARAILGGSVAIRRDARFDESTRALPHEIVELLVRRDGDPLERLLAEAPDAPGLAGTICALVATRALQAIPIAAPELPAPDRARHAKRLLEDLTRTAEDGDYFSILGVAPDASDADIARTHTTRSTQLAALALDELGIEELEPLRRSALAALSEAYRVLSVPRWRAAYAEALFPSPSSPPGPSTRLAGPTAEH